jgi:hypothetical protein
VRGLEDELAGVGVLELHLTQVRAGARNPGLGQRADRGAFAGRRTPPGPGRYSGREPPRRGPRS